MVVVAVSSMDPPLREPRTAGTEPISFARVACTAVSRSTTVIPTTTPVTPTSRRRRRPPRWAMAIPSEVRSIASPTTRVHAQTPLRRLVRSPAAESTPHAPGPRPDALAPARQEPGRVDQLPRPDERHHRPGRRGVVHAADPAHRVRRRQLCHAQTETHPAEPAPPPLC